MLGTGELPLHSHGFKEKTSPMTVWFMELQMGSSYAGRSFDGERNL